MLCEVVPLALEVHKEAHRIAARYGFRFYDSCIVTFTFKSDGSAVNAPDRGRKLARINSTPAQRPEIRLVSRISARSRVIHLHGNTSAYSSLTQPSTIPPLAIRSASLRTAPANLSARMRPSASRYLASLVTLCSRPSAASCKSMSRARLRNSESSVIAPDNSRDNSGLRPAACSSSEYAASSKPKYIRWRLAIFTSRQ